MNDQVKLQVLLEFDTRGADATLNNVRTVQRTLEDVNRTNKNAWNDGALRKFSGATNSVEKSLGAANTELKRSEESIISLRYANYDLANTLFAVSAAITAVGAASLIAFAQQESAFTEVERIAGGSLLEIQNLRDELQAMSTDIPVAFGELSNIASLGAALDIPAAELDEFTEAVAKFAATTGVTVEAAATGFGKLAAYLEIPEEQFENLGSAILRAGNISVATEEQVLKFAQALALPGARIGFTTDQVVALGATLASFGNINVEGAGSALNRVTKNIERALSENGEALDTWAATAGMSAESFRVAWGSDVSGTFNRVIKGLSGNIQGLVGNLDALGIRNVRDQRIIEALALNYGKYNKILGETTNAWREGTYMNEAYGLVLDDLASKFQIMLNAFTNFAAAIGAELAPAFGSLTDIITQALVAVTDFINSPLGGTLTRTVALLAGLAAGYAALRGVIALATASTLAFQFITRALGGAGIIAGLQGLATAILGVGTAGKHGAAGVWSLHGALKSLGRLVVVGAVLSYVSEWIFNTGEAAYNAGVVIGEFANFLLDTGQAINNFFGWGDASSDITYRAIRDWSDGLKSWGNTLIAQQKNADNTLSGIGDLTQGVFDLDEAFGGVNQAPFSGAGDSAASASRQVRTLVDYSNDLSQIWNRAFEIRFSGSQTLDAISSSFISIREAADEASKRIRDLKNDISGLSSDISIQEYFLSIAIEYGDTKRAEAIEADLLKKRAELADKTEDLQKEQDAASKSLVGNSKGAIENRKQVESLVQQYQAHIGALAASGMSQADLAVATQRLKADFMAQATQLGYNQQELQRYAAAFDDVAVAIARIPRNITVTADANPAIQAFNEYEASLNSARANAARGITMGPIHNNSNAKELRRMALEAEMITHSRNATMLSGMGGAANMQGARLSAYEAARIRAILASDNYAQGGFTGVGGKYEPAGIVHRGEYVIPKQHVNQATGLPYADALGRLMNGVPGMASGGHTTGGGQQAGVTTVALTAGTIQAIAQATGKIVMLDGKVIANSSSNQYATQTTVGAN